LVVTGSALSRCTRSAPTAPSAAKACGAARRAAISQNASEGRPHRAVFAEVWDGLYGRGAWDQNPLVAVIDFTVEYRNVDEMCEAECLDGAA